MDEIRIRDLPTIEEVDDTSYVIVEKPGYNEGTFKSTVETLQKSLKDEIAALEEKTKWHEM